LVIGYIIPLFKLMLQLVRYKVHAEGDLGYVMSLWNM